MTPPTIPSPWATRLLGRRGFLMGSALGATAALASMAEIAHAAGASSARRMPVIFIGHGSPMNALADNAFTRRLAAWGRELPRPTAILSVSAHWLSQGATGVTVQTRPKTIHDFGGFPQALFDIEYPAPGHPALAREAVGAVKQTPVIATEQWGLDHGTWTVLKHLYPKADVPVFQLSIDYDKPAAFHHAVGRDLSALRDQGVLVMGSGNVVHNLRRLDRALEDSAFDWGERFDAEVKRIMGCAPSQLSSVLRHPDYALSVPTPEHFTPLLYLAGLCSVTDEPVTVFAEGGTMGAITMTSYLVGGQRPSVQPQGGSGAASVPDLAVIPPEQTNL